MWGGGRGKIDGGPPGGKDDLQEIVPLKVYYTLMHYVSDYLINEIFCGSINAWCTLARTLQEHMACNSVL